MRYLGNAPPVVARGWQMSWRVAGLLLLVVLGIARGARGQQQHQHVIPEKLGKVSFTTSCSPSVQQPFERGVALLHSFAYEAAERQFADIIKADPDCAMAHWGVAMSYYHQLWEPRIAVKDNSRGAQEVAQAQKLRNVSAREAGFIGARGDFYRDAGGDSAGKARSGLCGGNETPGEPTARGR